MGVSGNSETPPAELRHISVHVEILPGAANGKYPDGNSLLVRGSLATVMIDPSLSVWSAVTEAGGNGVGSIDRVLVSHAHEDHLAGLGALDPAQINVHAADLIGVRSVDGLMTIYGLDDPADEAVWRSELVDRFHIRGWPRASGFTDGEVWDLGGVTVTALHLPGHTRGHSAFLVEPDGIAFVGDVDLSSFGPYYGDHWSDLDDFVASLRRVAEVDAARYVTFHHRGVIDGPAEFRTQLADFAAVIDRRDERVVELIGGGAATLEALVDAGLIYRPGTRPGSFGTSVERRSISQHLRRLERNGVITRHPDQRWTVN